MRCAFKRRDSRGGAKEEHTEEEGAGGIPEERQRESTQGWEEKNAYGKGRRRRKYGILGKGQRLSTQGWEEEKKEFLVGGRAHMGGKRRMLNRKAGREGAEGLVGK